MKLPNAVFADAEGYIERECPNCRYSFKVKADHWVNRLFSEEVYCPKCSSASNSDNWWSVDQIDLIKELLSSGRPYSDDEYVCAGNIKDEDDISEVYCRIKYSKGRRTSFSNNPVGKKREWENVITCNSCSTQYKTAGDAFTCPCCAYSNVISVFGQFLKGLSLMFDCIPEMMKILSVKGDSDQAYIMRNELLNDVVCEGANGFSLFLYQIHSRKSVKDVNPSVFNKFVRADKMMNSALGIRFSDVLCAEEYIKMSELYDFASLVLKNKTNGKTVTTDDVRFFVESLEKLYNKVYRSYMKI